MIKIRHSFKSSRRLNLGREKKKGDIRTFSVYMCGSGRKESRFRVAAPVIGGF